MGMHNHGLDKKQVIAESLPMLAKGISTEVIAKQYGIDGSTLRRWLVNDQDAEEARADYLTGKVMESLQAIDDAADQFPLAHARERFKAWSWIAERRLPSRFAPKQEINQGISISVQINRTHDAQYVTIEQDPPVPLPGALSDGGGGK